MTIYAITDTKKRRTGIAPTYLQTTPGSECSTERKFHGSESSLWSFRSRERKCRETKRPVAIRMTGKSTVSELSVSELTVSELVCPRDVCEAFYVPRPGRAGPVFRLEQ